MAISYSWKVTQMTKKTIGDNENVVLHVRWECAGTTDTTGTIGKFSGATPLDFDSSSTDEFLAFGDLTEDIVIGWVKDIVTDESTGYFDHISEQIQKEIDKVDDPEEEIGEEALPWSTGSVEPTTDSEV